MENLLTIMRRLRGPGGCPWDQKQSHASLREHLLEEAAEAVDAISADDTAAMVEELGDVLLQVAFHAVIAEESQRFHYPAIEQSIVEKLIRRHPHIFGDAQAQDADEVLRNWQRIKAEEKAAAGHKVDDPAAAVPQHLPTLMRAAALGKALQWPSASAQDLQQALAAPLDNPEEHIGTLLLAVVDYARSLGVNPDIALREALEARKSP